jgi:hypothetical protein
VKISIVTSEPGTREGVGAFEWHTEHDAAEKAFRQFRTLDSTTKLWHDVEIPDGMTGEEITERVDYTYWEAETYQWGEPDRVYVGPQVEKKEES